MVSNLGDCHRGSRDYNSSVRENGEKVARQQDEMNRALQDCRSGPLMATMGFVSLIFAGFMLYRRRDIKRMSPTAPNELTHDLIAQAWLGAIAMAMLALVTPPNFVLAAAGLVGCPAIAAIGGPALASIGAAWFGGIAYAARQAL